MIGEGLLTEPEHGAHGYDEERRCWPEVAAEKDAEQDDADLDTAT